MPGCQLCERSRRTRKTRKLLYLAPFFPGNAGYEQRVNV